MPHVPEHDALTTMGEDRPCRPAMKVLVNAFSARRGGIFTYTRNLRAAFTKNGIDATIAMPAAGPDDQLGISFAVNVDRFNPVHRLYWEQTTWRAIVRRHNPSVLFSSANFALFRCPVPQLLLMREGGLFNPFYLRHIMPTLGKGLGIENILRRHLMLRSIRAATLVMFPSETLRDWVLTYCPDLAGRDVVNSYGVDLDHFRPSQPKPPAADEPLRLLYVSVYYPHKDPQTLLEAVRILRARGMDAQARITMEQPQFKHWPPGPAVYAALKAGERDGHLVLGPVRYEDLPATYHAHDFFIFPSVSETFGFPLVEAMACGLPVIASDTPTNREICGAAALYYPAFDASALAQRVLDLRARPDLYRWLTAKGVERARDRFNLADHFKRLVALLEQIQDAGLGAS
jgi:glycosyltransferase involved in cell wall biosynthesis